MSLDDGTEYILFFSLGVKCFTQLECGKVQIVLQVQVQM